MAWSTTRRLPLSTYQPVAKRQRTLVRRPTRTLPVRRFAKPEIKQWISVAPLTDVINGAYVSIPVAMAQGDDGNDFLGAKFRILRVRIYYDYTTTTPTESIRMGLGVPKNPDTAELFPVTTGQSQVVPTSYFEYTMLKEKYLKTDGSDYAGMMEWTGPLNVEMNQQGTSPVRNNLLFQVNSPNEGTRLAASNRTRIEVLFTG